jgi:hypothetical protein
MFPRSELPMMDDAPMLFDAPLSGWFPGSARRFTKPGTMGLGFVH